MTVATKKLLLDVREAGESILQHTAGKNLAEYIGEALNRIDRLDPPVAARISELRPVVDFRNRIIHGYDTVDDTVVWGIVERHLPVLINEIAELLDADDAAA